MSLVKQLWLGTSLLILTAFLASLAASLVSAQSYYQEQLMLKNIDSANSLALTMSHSEKEQALMASFLDAQFSTGHYQRIELSQTDGQSLSFTASPADHQAPSWFRVMFPLDIPPGVATVSDGWVNFGTLYVESARTYAQTSLWVTAQRLFIWLCLVAVIAGLIGSWLVRRISSPLNDVVKQAEAIGEKRFIVSEEPNTTEFRRVVSAMNKLSRRVETILESEAKALADMRERALNDPVTGVANREFFISQLNNLIDDPESDTRHTLVLLRIPGLAELNAQLGRDQVNEALQIMCGNVLKALSNSDLLFQDAFMGRLNGSDFGLLVTGFQDASHILPTLEQMLTGPVMRRARLSVSTFDSTATHAAVLMHADHLLATAEQTNQRAVVDEDNPEDIPFRNAAEWRTALNQALEERAIDVAFHPLIDRSGNIIQVEAKVRLKLLDQWRPAGFFLPWGRRLGLLPHVDTAMVQYLLETFTEQGELPVVVHIARETLLDETLRRTIVNLLSQRHEPRRSFRLELPEEVLAEGELLLGRFVEEIQTQGCQVGISGIGKNLESIAKVHELGLDYLKTDPVYAQRLEDDPATQQYLQRLTGLAHSIGLSIYLAGAKTDGCVQAAWNVGLDGVTGPGVKSGN
ncbi:MULTISPECIES: EAL domain-containing protein [Marinobacter]|uniref:EAL domain-containing protein n=1 Tax=Marinobacter TaxID=2742 RepID=UPI001C9784C9|nr:LapD/MoxY N-terminal periplasmic domain-containing protein [Marinobacter nauticus]MBY6192170.1 EAL domain-containing protein [Marinobacter nauticus]MBY6213318.1 EAL domain-containing protein [Marinobacter nauticus]